jgi:hypothetical protein
MNSICRLNKTSSLLINNSDYLIQLNPATKRTFLTFFVNNKYENQEKLLNLKNGQKNFPILPSNFKNILHKCKFF